MDNNIIQQYNEQYKYKGGTWNQTTCLVNNKIETYSGPGSLLHNNDNLIKILPIFFKNHNIGSIIDVPCGDFNFMKKVITPETNIDYTGIDVAENAINMCRKYENQNIKFKVDDITDLNIKLKEVDLIICKDLTLHLCFSDIKKLLKNIEKSKCKYFACSRFCNGNILNKDMPDGQSGFGCRPIEITREPFNFNYREIEQIKYKTKDLPDELVIFKIK